MTASRSWDPAYAVVLTLVAAPWKSTSTNCVPFLMRGFAGLNALFDKYGFPERELEIMSRGVIEVIEQAGMG